MSCSCVNRLNHLEKGATVFLGVIICRVFHEWFLMNRSTQTVVCLGLGHRSISSFLVNTSNFLCNFYTNVSENILLKQCNEDT